MADFGTLLAPGVVRFERLLPGPIERVWAYLKEPEKRARWLAGGVMELRVGGRVELRFWHADLSPIAAPTPERFAASAEANEVQGTVTACDPPHRLAFTWGEGGDRWSEVTFELEAVGDGVRLTVTHRRLGDEPAVWANVAGGWHTHLAILEDRLEGRVPTPSADAHPLRPKNGSRVPCSGRLWWPRACISAHPTWPSSEPRFAGPLDRLRLVEHVDRDPGADGCHRPRSSWRSSRVQLRPVLARPAEEDRASAATLRRLSRTRSSAA